MWLIKCFRILFWSGLLLGVIVFEFHAKTGVTASDASLPHYRHTLTGNIKIHKGFHSRFRPTDRDINVYLPVGYETNGTRRYPVLYMQDGQNIFDAATSFFSGQEEYLDEEAQTLVARHEVEPLIIVGISSGGLARLNEFTPPAAGKQGGKADLYGRMLVEEIKPFIDAQYRTLKGRSHTGLGGRSLGGLATLYLGLKYRSVFGNLAVVSPAAFWNDRMIVRYVESLRSKTNQRISLSIGTAESADFFESTRALHQALIRKGWIEGSDLAYLEAQGIQHGPDKTHVRVDHLLRFLSPSVSRSPKRMIR